LILNQIGPGKWGPSASQRTFILLRQLCRLRPSPVRYSRLAAKNGQPARQTLIKEAAAPNAALSEFGIPAVS
jgi:hypothetical protein